MCLSEILGSVVLERFMTVYAFACSFKLSRKARKKENKYWVTKALAEFPGHTHALKICKHPGAVDPALPSLCLTAIMKNQ